MGKFFDLDSPLMRFLNRMADLLWLNFLTLLLCIPVITAGAAFTALHFTCLKLVRGEEGYITKDYFRSFKTNFIQSTVIWLIVLATGGILALDYKLVFFSGETEGTVSLFHSVLSAGLIVAGILYILTLMFIFPVQSHFINPIGKTIKNSFLLSMMVLPRTILMLLLQVLPVVIAYFIQPAFLLCILFFFSVPAYFGAKLYDKTFARFEPEKEETNDDFTWSVSSDEDGDSEEALTASDENNVLAEDENGNTDPDGRAGSGVSADWEEK